MSFCCCNRARKRDGIELTSILAENRSPQEKLIDSSVSRRLAPTFVVLVGKLQVDPDLHHHFVHLTELKLMFGFLKGAVQIEHVLTAVPLVLSPRTVYGAVTHVLLGHAFVLSAVYHSWTTFFTVQFV